MVTVHDALVVQPVAPVQLVKVEVESATAVSTMIESRSKGATQEGPQSIPATSDVTVPPPVPAFVTASVVRVKEAVTFRAALIVTSQKLVPGQPSSDQPEKIDVESGLAESLTTEPVVNPAAQVAPQEIPTGKEVIVPPPVPLFATVSVWPGFVKVAVT